MLFEYIKASALKHGDLIAQKGPDDTHIGLMIVHELHEDEVSGEPAIAVDGVMFNVDFSSREDNSQPLRNIKTNAKFILRDYPSILLLKRATIEE